RYQTMWVTTGARRSGMTTSSRPLASVKCATLAAAAEGEVIAIRFGSKEARPDAAAARRNRDDPATYRTPRALPPVGRAGRILGLRPRECLGRPRVRDEAGDRRRQCRERVSITHSALTTRATGLFALIRRARSPSIA